MLQALVKSVTDRACGAQLPVKKWSLAVLAVVMQEEGLREWVMPMEPLQSLETANILERVEGMRDLAVEMLDK
jgi:PIN domain nuclease of toxin-antitoxin system